MGTAWRSASAASCSRRLLKNAIGADDERAARSCDERREGRVDFALVLALQDMELQPERAGRRLHVSRLVSASRSWSG